MQHAEEGDATSIQTLLDNGISPNSRDESGVNALMAAASEGKLKVVQTLIRNGADVNSQDKKGELHN